jgi:aryl-alcohol dehydrogenase-like predicted oxidoreductase
VGAHLALLRRQGHRGPGADRHGAGGRRPGGDLTVSAEHQTVDLGEKRLTRIGLGTNRLDDTPESRSFLEAAAQTELNFIDTAHLYASGDSERVIGSVLSPFTDDLVVATKGGYNAGVGIDGMRAQLEESLERFRTETIDLYYVHRVHPDHDVEPSMELLAEYRDAGRIAHIGLSEVTIGEIDRAQAIAPVAAVQNEYSLAERKHDDVIDFCAVEGIVFVPFFPLRGKSPALADIAERHGATPNQIKLAWLLRRSPNVVPIPGTLSLEHLKENLAAREIELSDEEFERLGAR